MNAQYDKEAASRWLQTCLSGSALSCSHSTNYSSHQSVQTHDENLTKRREASPPPRKSYRLVMLQQMKRATGTVLLSYSPITH